MPQLRNGRRERMARNLAAGMSQLAAYKDAGFIGDDANANRVANAPEVVERVNELMAEKQQARKRLDDARKAVLAGEEIVLSVEFLKAEALLNLERARETGNIREANHALKMIIDLAGVIPKRKPGRPPTKREKEKSEVADDPDTGHADPISALDQLARRFSDFVGDGAEEGTEADAQPGPGDREADGPGGDGAPVPGGPGST